MEPIDYMKEALALARRGLGYTTPNPAVGCVIVKNGKIVGRGYHHKAGTPHAEVWALRDAGDDQAKDATVYVTLEPCAHYGRTPPCARTLVEKGVGKVVMAMLDPNPLVAGKGAAILRQAGIPVEIGLLSKEATQINEVFIKNMMVQRPFIAAKIAQSLDGRIASRTRKSQWITNEWARQKGHYLRSIYDGILVGINTILEDNPLLTCRISRDDHDRPHQPSRIILDSQGRIPMNSLVVTDKSARTIVVTTSLCPVEKMRYLKQAGVQVMFAPLQRDHHIDLKAAIELLGKEGITGILVEGGSTVQGSFFDAKLVDKIYAFIGDKVIGGTGALPSVGGFGVDTLDECMPLQYDSIELTEGNILITAYNTNREGAYVHWNH
ncbi:MAG: bifunctional diaminohydroxyphosphoribosylaminopyrimidine deaminase/5-amino-6-(5-phosphoribosylamino)uracil reductase RibD [Megasphaera sp.]|nr:bifunctional diaminohydroxyphosphoribosylaminopyrimidine deaminase/5-amino-6-(5-phosphoribosylamino)uracil reductase RibD [Megasphaera sp.]MCH4187997.1 bifunctional diaminohydroxyphosphoribosylaminopyrimidine deaminase/5-amino-6-(5-phosphoribosylamino)uracil reductase RibD [Megasphaera sp.]MCH4217717.1 bifunctional diaminohydroxyphosphoribosylaminopyrimidine deaminase/5-amino-6-(5-phosphoribosylamino)uracil reductase RibD [Megasphaera sp.]